MRKRLEKDSEWREILSFDIKKWLKNNTKDKDISKLKGVRNLHTILSRRPKSERFSQIYFDGFHPKGKSFLEIQLLVVKDFVSFLVKYFRRKVKHLGKGYSVSLKFIYNQITFSKILMVRKLVWSRGRLGRPIATAVVMFFAFIVFLFGEVLNSNRLVNSAEINPDYLSNVSDFIPQRDTALTKIPDSRKSTEPFTYIVEGGDTLSSIGNKFRISVDALQYVNNLNDNAVLKVGQAITIPPVQGLIHKVERGDTLNSIATKYEVAPQAIADFNYILDTSRLALGTELVIPNAKVPEPVVVPSFPSSATAPPSSAPPAIMQGKGFCVWPAAVRLISQNFYWYHTGIDIASYANDPYVPLYACTDGVVTRAGWDPFGLGLHVRIDHGNGYETVYGHMSRLDVTTGQRVKRGQSIGRMGSTGRSTGPHVHFMVRINGVPQNPLNFTE